MGTTIVLILRKKLKGNFAACAIFFAVLQKGIGVEDRHSGVGERPFISVPKALEKLASLSKSMSHPRESGDPVTSKKRRGAVPAF